MHRILALLVFLFFCTDGKGQFYQITWNTPNGNPTGPAWFLWGTQLHPTAATWSDGPASLDLPLLGCLDAMGITSIERGGTWTINNCWFAGTVTLEDYFAWENISPAYSLGNWTIEAENLPNWGGALIALTYLPSPNDPPGNTHWLQLATLNDWSAFPNYVVVNNNAIDNQPLPPNVLWPFYDSVPNPNADPQHFLDCPLIHNGTGTVSFQLRLATWDPDNLVLNLSNQVLWWGFDV
jgi:hypothetical protein